jgi:hypothetical protein
MILDLSIVLDDEPAYAEYNDRIIKTLLQMQAGGRKRATIKSALSYYFFSRSEQNKLFLLCYIM